MSNETTTAPQVQSVADPASQVQSVADPAPLGLAAFGLTTFILSAVNAGLIPKPAEPVVLGVALAYGGLAQFCAGMWEFQRNNTFGATDRMRHSGSRLRSWSRSTLEVFRLRRGLQLWEHSCSRGVFSRPI
jgi:hypothetical protein